MDCLLFVLNKFLVRHFLGVKLMLHENLRVCEKCLTLVFENVTTVTLQELRLFTRLNINGRSLRLSSKGYINILVHLINVDLLMVERCYIKWDSVLFFLGEPLTGEFSSVFNLDIASKN